MTKKIKFLILGFGIFGEYRLIPGFRNSKNAEIYAITKTDLKAAQEKAEKHKIPKYFAYSDQDQYLHDDNIDAVYIATPNNMHMKDTIDCLKAGKSVIVEKPMAMNTEECHQMVDFAQKNKGKLMIAHCMRYNKTINYVKEQIDKGILGNILSITADFFSDASKSARKWKFNQDIAGGGAAFDLGVHLIDTIRYLAGSNIVKAENITIQKDTTQDRMDLLASFLLKFQNDIIGRATASYLGKRKLFLEVFGENGYIRAYNWNENNQIVRIESDINDKFETYNVQNQDMYADMIDDFCRAIVGEKQIAIPGQEGLINQQIIDLIYK